ncbi:MAG: DegV family protein [Firmicutes bacterium]|nr:DegV family protein [Bacillota bacterium]
MKFIISTDTSCDIPRDQLKQLNVPFVPLTYIIDGESHQDNFSTQSQFKDFYARVRGGALPKTSQINTEEHAEFFVDLIKNGAKNILHLCLSSALSATHSGAIIAAKQVMGEYEDVKIVIVDTKAATCVGAFLLNEALKLKAEGKQIDEAAAILNELKLKIFGYAMADDLSHLKRGGRLSATKAFIGTLLKVKPVLSIDKEGALNVVHKAKGTKSVFAFFAEQLKEYGHDFKNQEYFIAHADCEDVADELIEYLRAAGANGKPSKSFIGPVIGAHTGAGTLVIAFKSGQERLN